MKRRVFLQMALGAGYGSVGARTGLHWDSRHFNAMGSTMSLQAAHAQRGVAAQALDAALEVVRTIEDQMSLFRSDSAISLLNQRGRLERAPTELLEVLRLAQHVSRRSAGAFDVTVQPLWRLFDSARQEGRLPTAQELEAARRLVDYRSLRLTPTGLQLPSGRSITLNGIAQGYAADRVRATLARWGIAHALIHTGEWAGIGGPDHTGEWTLGVANPRDPQHLLARVALRGRCVATSADDQCSFSPDHVYHHIFDPRTGCSPTELSSVSVFAPGCALADALTKVFFMAGYERALPLARAWGVGVLVVDKGGRWKASPDVALLHT